MKNFTAVLFISLLLFSSVNAVDYKNRDNKKSYKHSSILKNVDIDIEDGSIVITSNDYEDETVKITEDYELYVNGKLIKTNEEQQELVAKYYDLFQEIIQSAKKIGYEGAKLGVEGAKIGAQAVSGIFKLLLSDYDSEDFEKDIERKAEKLEAKADKLEEKAEVLEDMADEFEEIHEKLKDQIPELNKLEWF
jgi:hypothetical protein